MSNDNGVQSFERFFYLIVNEVGVNLGRRNITVSQGALDHAQVCGRVTEVGGEGCAASVAHRYARVPATP